MEAETERTLARRRAYHRHVFARLRHLVDFSTYMDGLADLIGCKPRLRDFATRPKLLYRLYTSAFCGVQYRFRGPHADPELAARIILSARSHVRAARFVDLALAELGRVAGARRFQPRLTLLGRLHESPLIELADAEPWIARAVAV